MLDAYREYLDAVLRDNTQARHDTRIEARAARSRAQASLDRLRAEPASHTSVPRAEVLVAQANRVVRAAMTLEASRSDAASITNAQLDAFVQACDAALLDAATALRDSRAPKGEHPLRVRQLALAASLPEPGGAFEAGLRDAGDRIVDAIESLLHVLAHAHVGRAQPAA